PVNGSLDLDKGIAPRNGNVGRKRQGGLAVRPPSAILGEVLAGLVPALHKVVVDIDGGRTGQFDIDVVVLAFTAMAGRDHRVGIEIDSPDERRLALVAGIDEPAFLVLAKTGVGTVPPDSNSGSSNLQFIKMVHGSPKGVALPILGLCGRPPEEDPHV